MKRKYPEWLKIAEVFVLFFVVSPWLFYHLERYFPGLLVYAYYFIVALFLFQALLSYIYSFAALAHQDFEDLSPEDNARQVPKTTVIVSAYLPNEVEVIEATLLNLLINVERPKNGIEIILAYNTPRMVGIEPRLRSFAYKWPELILANAYNSRSKGENLNYAISMASGEMIVLFDSDHRVDPDCLKRAWRWLERGYDVVQGRCKIRNGYESMLTALVEVEFEVIYAVSHFAKTTLFNTGLFGGSNGYWKAAALKKTVFNHHMLTEDIDATIRSLLIGVKFIHDRSIVATELAPTTLTGLWHQRKRWAQGWFQCSLKHQRHILGSPHLTARQKFLWTTLLGWRIFFDTAIHFLPAVLIAHWAIQNEVRLPLTPFIIFSILFTFLSGPIETIAAYKNAVKPRDLAQYFYFALMTFPYSMIKDTIQVIAVRDELLGHKEWIPTKRD